MAVKFIRIPFATNGDKTTVPDPTQLDGSVSYDQGFGLDYQKVYPDDANAKAFPRAQFNELMFDTTVNINQYQTHGVPEFITTADNNGTPYPYAKWAFVRYDGLDGNGSQVYQSLITANTNTPTPSASDANWRLMNNTMTAPLIQTGASVYALDTGAANAYVVNPVLPLLAYVAGVKIRFKAAVANTAASTINISALGTKNIYQQTYSGPVALTGGEIRANIEYEVIYDGTQFQLLNPSYPSALTNNGYLYLANNLLLQWGNGTIPASSAQTAQESIVFPVAFSSLFSITTSYANAPNGTTTALTHGAFSATTSGFVFHIDTAQPAQLITNGVGVSWMALGV